MSDGFLTATSSEGLLALGSAAQRSFELIVGTLRSHLDEATACLFAEPISTARGASIEWYAPLPGRVVSPAQQTDAMRDDLRRAVQVSKASILALADRIAAKAGPDDFWLAEALRNAVEFPDDAAIWGVRRADGQLQPVLVNWARLHEDRPAVRGVLSTMAPVAPTPPPPVAVPVSDQRSPPPDAAVFTSAAPGLASHQAIPFWPLILLGWLILAVMIATLIWLMIAPCGLRPWPFSQCGARAAVSNLGIDRQALLADIAGLEQRVADQGLACSLAEVRPRLTPPVPVPDPQKAGALDNAELDRRLANHGLTPGAALMISLVWSGRDDLDLKLQCPGGAEVDFRNKSVSTCNAQLDVDANFPVAAAVDDPVENISVSRLSAGRYVVSVQRATDRPPSGPTTFRVFVQQEGAEPRTMDGRLPAPGDIWTQDLEIAAP